MNENNTPERPSGLDGTGQGPTVPRVEVEPTPRPTRASAEGSSETEKTTAMPGARGAGPTPPSPGPDDKPPFVPAQEVSTRTVVKTKTKKIPVFVASLAGLAVGAVLVIALVMTGAFRITGSNVEASGGSSQQTIKIDSEDTTLAEAVSAKALPSVVSITTQTSDGGGIGSGVVLDGDGNIITNYHVIADATSIVVSTSDGSSYEAELVGSDESSDLAVVRLSDPSSANLTPIEVGDSDDLKVGEWVMAIGSPFGNEQSVSTGIVSALYRSTALPSTSGSTIYANMIQTDAAINPGNSGGALVNDEGKLIGINSIIESYSGSSSGVGFAIPVNYAKDIADQIIAGEVPAHPYLGVSVTSVNAYNARQNNLAVNEGAYIESVNEGTPAADAGLEKGDIVTALDGEEVTSADSLIILTREHKIGDKVTLTVQRGSDQVEVDVTLGSDADLNTEQQDSSTGDSAGNSMTEEQFLQYLEQYLGNGGRNGSIG